MVIFMTAIINNTRYTLVYNVCLKYVFYNYLKYFYSVIFYCKKPFISAKNSLMLSPNTYLLVEEN